MAIDNSEFDISSTLIYTEQLKAELLNSIAKLYTSMTDGEATTSRRADLLSDIIINTYLISDKLGVSYNALDTKILSRIRLLLMNSEDNLAVKQDLLNLSKHIDKNRIIK